MTAVFQEGDLLLERFRLVRALDPDGASHLWVAEDRELQESVAVRILSPELATSEAHREHLRAAARGARRLRHPHVVPVFDFYRDGQTCFVSRELVEGTNVSAFRGRPPSELLRELVPLLEALEYAHREGAVHGDLKGTKILVDRAGRARIADFGIAGALRDAGELLPGADLPALTSIWFELVTGASAEQALADGTVSESLEALGLGADVGSAFSRMLQGTETDVAEVARALSSPAAEPGPVIVPVRVGDRLSDRRSDDRISTNTWLMVGFAALVVLALGVFVVLPRLVGPPEIPGRPETAAAPEKTGAEEKPTAEATAIPAEGATPDEARRLLGQVLNRAEHLREIGVQEWAPEGIASVDAHVAAGEQAQVEKDMATAVGHYREALTTIEALEARSQEVLAEALEAGAAGLASLELPEATRRFELALVVERENPTAQAGLERVTALERILAFMKAGTDHEDDGRLEDARDAYAQALEVDPDWIPARESLERVEAVIAANAFDRHMALAVTLLAQEKFADAEKNADAALALRPRSPEARDVRARVQQRRLTIAIASGRRRAQAAESKEAWAKATEEYRRLLQLDSNLGFAQEGFERASRRAAWSDRLDAWNATPSLLFDASQRDEARQIITSARSTPDPGPRLRRQLQQAEALLHTASTPIEVVIESDGETEVQVQRVGPIGSFERRSVPLTPGVYVIRGIRRGFRDVRRTVTVIPGQAVPTVVVRCTEKI